EFADRRPPLVRPISPARRRGARAARPAAGNKMTESYVLRVNGADRAVADASLGESLLTVLRDRLGMPAAKAGCEQGECGSCSVLVDGDLVCSCLVLAATAAGAEIVTLEGLQPEEQSDLTDVQRAFVQAGAVQCG